MANCNKNQFVGIKDIALALGVSKTTVSRALNNAPNSRMKKETKELIVKKACEMGYRPSLLAQGLFNQRTSILGVVVPMIGDTVSSSIVRGLESVAYEKGYNIILCDTDINLEKEKVYIDLLIML